MQWYIRVERERPGVVSLRTGEGVVLIGSRYISKRTNGSMKTSVSSVESQEECSVGVETECR